MELISRSLLLRWRWPGFPSIDRPFAVDAEFKLMWLVASRKDIILALISSGLANAKVQKPISIVFPQIRREQG